MLGDCRAAEELEKLCQQLENDRCGSIAWIFLCHKAHGPWSNWFPLKIVWFSTKEGINMYASEGETCFALIGLIPIMPIMSHFLGADHELSEKSRPESSTMAPWPKATVEVDRDWIIFTFVGMSQNLGPRDPRFKRFGSFFSDHPILEYWYVILTHV